MSWQYPLAATDLAGPAGGALAGNYPDPTIAALAVTTAALAAQAVTAAKIANLTITAAQIANATITLAKLSASLPYVLVQTGVPSTFTSPLVYDNTVVSGGLYGWAGSAYSKIGGLAS